MAKPSRTSASLIAMATLWSGAAAAQSPDPAASADAAGVAEIVVTATRREQRAQDVGIAISAFSQDTLRTLTVFSTEDLTQVTPGLQLSIGGGSPLVGLLSIRGVSQNDFAGHIEAPNAFYVDEVYQPSISTSVQQLFDVQRVEVLKGPQGTLFGRNATGGLIQIITNKPGDEWDGYAQVGGGNFGQVRLEAGVTAPITDGLSIRTSFLREVRDGFFQNAIGPAINQDDTAAGRVQILARPNERLSILVSGSVYKIHPVTAGAAYATAGVPDASGLGQPLPPGSPTGFGYVAGPDVFKGAFNEPGLLKRTQKDLSGNITYDLGNDISLIALGSYSELANRYREDNDLSPFPISVFFQDATASYGTADVRLQKARGRFRWTVGGFYLTIDGTYRQAFLVQVLNNTLLDANYRQTTDSWSIYGEAEYDLLDRVTLIGGLRYTHDDKTYDYRNVCTGPGCALFILPNTIGGAGRFQDSHGEGGISARAQVNWKPTDDLLLYASYNRGYKAFNYNAGFAGQAPLALARFKGETIDAFEIGEKADLFDKRVRLNVSAFYYDYTNYQAFDQRGLNFTLFNTDATVYGADGELQVSPGHGFTFGAGASLLHTKVENVPLFTGPVSRRAPQSPDYTVNLLASKSLDTRAGTFLLAMNATYTDEFFSQLTNAPVTLIPSNWVVNGRLSWTEPKHRFQVAVFARNLLDEARQIYAFDITGPPFGLVERNFAPPRQFGAELRVMW